MKKWVHKLSLELEKSELSLTKTASLRNVPTQKYYFCFHKNRIFPWSKEVCPLHEREYQRTHFYMMTTIAIVWSLRKSQNYYRHRLGIL